MTADEQAIAGEQKELLDLAARVPPQELQTAKRLLRPLIADPFWLSIYTAPLDGEPVTGEDILAMELGRKEIAQGRGIPHEHIRREFGIE